MSSFSWRKARQGIAVIAGVSLVAACTDAPYSPPTLPFLGNYKAHADSVPRVLENHDWWRQFKDPVLDGLVERALADSLSLELAKERVIEAQAARDGLPMAARLSPNARVQR